MDYLLDYCMSEPSRASIRYKDFFDNFKAVRQIPAKSQNYLDRDLVLKSGQLGKCMKVFQKAYPSKTFSLVSKNLPLHQTITQITSEKAYLRSSYKFLNYRSRKLLKSGEMIQIDGTNIVFFTYLEKKMLVSLSIYKTSNKLCLRMEGAHRKKIFSSNYIETEALEDLFINETIVLNQYILF
jgi:hypothetical protein